MKKYILLPVLVLGLASCNNGNNTTDNTKQNAAANDSMPHPNGMTEPSVISVDTSATRVNSDQRK